MAGVEKYTATVTDNRDPERRARIKVRCEDLLDGDVDEQTGERAEAPDLPDWIDPRFDFAAAKTQSGKFAGFFYVPRPGDVVEIELTEDDDLETEDRIIWVAGIYPNPEDITPLFRGEIAPGINAEDVYPNIMGWRSYEGHMLVFADLPGKDAFVILAQTSEYDDDGVLSLQRFLVLGSQDGFDNPVMALIDTKGNQFSIEENGEIKIVSAEYSHSIIINETEIKVSHRVGHEVLVDDAKIRLHHNDGGEVTITDAATDLTNKNSERIRLEDKGSGISEVTIGVGAAEPIALGATLQSLFATMMAALSGHIHAGPGGVPPDGFTGPPGTASAALFATLTTLFAGTTWLSDLAKTKK